MVLMVSTKADIIARLRRDILPLGGFRSAGHGHDVIDLGPINQAFPDGAFPLGAIHEFISSGIEDTAATSGFILGIISRLAQKGGLTLWISDSRTLFPPALLLFGVQPDNIIFLDLERELDCLWAAEEALKSEGLAAVVCEVQNLSFTASRRLQLAVEGSGITGFIFRKNPRKLTPTASIAQWKITSLPSETAEDMPGVGFPRWQVNLTKVRNGKPGSWQFEFAGKNFRPLPTLRAVPQQLQKKAV
jgi:protein ImuA